MVALPSLPRMIPYGTSYFASPSGAAFNSVSGMSSVRETISIASVSSCLASNRSCSDYCLAKRGTNPFAGSRRLSPCPVGINSVLIASRALGRATYKRPLDHRHNFFAFHIPKPALTIFPSICGHRIGHLLGFVVIRSHHEIVTDGAMGNGPRLSEDLLNQNFGVAIHGAYFVLSASIARNVGATRARVTPSNFKLRHYVRREHRITKDVGAAEKMRAAPEAGDQDQASTHRELLPLKAVVVSVAEKRV